MIETITLIIYLAIGIILFGAFSAANNEVKGKMRIEDSEKPAAFIVLALFWPVVLLTVLGSVLYQKAMKRRESN